MKTTDLGLAAALFSLGHSYNTMTLVGQRRVEIEFPEKKEIDKAVTDYFSNKLQVSARDYFSSISQLKSDIYNTIENNSDEDKY